MIAVIADTHLPRGRRRLPERCLEILAGVEAVVHAGDLTSSATLDELADLCPVVHAVHGNVDEPALRSSLPAELELDLNGARLAVVHDAGPAKGRVGRLRSRFPAADAVVFGHSHLPLHEEDEENGFQIFNPGSPTERRRGPRCSMGLLDCEGGRLAFEHVWL
jgi:putative phosphoesterase